jgi:hypothetical protein
VPILVTIEMISQINSTLHNLVMTKWLTEELFSIRWWGTLGFVIFSYILCFSLLDKTRFVRILLFGSLISVFSVVIDLIGTNFNLWVYRSRLFPITPSIFIYDITALPLYYMLMYQYATSWKSYAAWNIMASAAMGFIFTPLMVTLGVLQLINWNYFYAFLTITFIGFLGKAVTSFIIYIEEKNQSEQRQNLQAPSLLQPAMKPLDEQREKQGDRGNES